MILYRFSLVRRLIGGKWGHVTGLFFGKKWVRLPTESLMWHERWSWSCDSTFTKRPTIEELETILNSEDKRDIEIMPDGSVRVL